MIRYTIKMQYREVQRDDKVQQYDVCSMVMRSSMMIWFSTVRCNMVMESP